MEGLEEADVLLANVEKELQQRVDGLLQMNDDYRGLLLLLEKERNVLNDLEQRTTSPAHDNHNSREDVDIDSVKGTEKSDMEDLSLNSKLDDILLQAKSIRSREKSSQGRSKIGKKCVMDKGIEKATKCAPISATRRGEEKSDRKSERTSSSSSSSSSKNTKQNSQDFSSSSSSTSVNNKVRDFKEEGMAHTNNERKHNGHNSHLSTLYEIIDDFLDLKLLHPLHDMLSPRDLFLSQTKMLSQLQCVSSFPPSPLLTVFIAHFDKIMSSADLLNELAPDQCSSYLLQYRTSFEKTLLSKLKRLGETNVLENLSESNIMDLCSLWWNIRLCILLYDECQNDADKEINDEVFKGETNEMDVNSPYNKSYGLQRPCQNDNSKETNSCLFVSPRCESEYHRLQALCRELICELPLYSLDNTVEQTEAFHEQVQTRVFYAVETVLSKLMLRPVLHEMKECVYKTSHIRTNLGTRGEDSISDKRLSLTEQKKKSSDIQNAMSLVEKQWVTTLQVFQEAYQMLAGNEATNRHSRQPTKVLFLKKDIKV